jgi:hypothetical protein
MYLACIYGGNDPAALARCLSALHAWGGEFFPQIESSASKQLPHPIHVVSAQWKHEQLVILLQYTSYHYPMTNSELGGRSLGSTFAYPIHAAIISLRQRLHSAFNGEHFSNTSKEQIAM